jgi:hypothetical protein
MDNFDDIDFGMLDLPVSTPLETASRAALRASRAAAAREAHFRELCAPHFEGSREGAAKRAAAKAAAAVQAPKRIRLTARIVRKP